MKKKVIAVIMSAAMIGMYSFGGVVTAFADDEQSVNTNVTESQSQTAEEQPQSEVKTAESEAAASAEQPADSAEAASNEEKAPEATITLSKTSINLGGSASTISATVKNAPAGSTVVWTSSDTSYVTVTADSTDSTQATLFAIKKTADDAPATITATISGTNISATCTVKVTGANEDYVSKWTADAGKTVTAAFYIHTSPKEEIKFNVTSNSPQGTVNYIPGNKQIQAEITLPTAYTSADGSGVYYNVGGAQLPGITLNSAVYKGVTYDLTTKAGIQALFNACGKNVEIKGSYIKWYVIKLHNDGYHVDGYVQAKCQLLYNQGNITGTASDMPNTENVDLNENATVSTAKPTCEGRRFLYWKGSDGNKYYGGETVTMTDDFTLTAVWTNILKYDANASADTVSNVPSDNNEYEDGNTANVSSDIPTRAGYVFGGWSITKTGTVAVNTVDFKGSDITLYAIWNKCYTLTYNANAGDETVTVPVDSTKYTNGITAAASKVLPVRKGYTCTGWSTTADGTTPVDSVTFNGSDITLYAIWTINTPTVPTDPTVTPTDPTTPVVPTTPIVDPSDNSNTDEPTTPIVDPSDNSNTGEPTTPVVDPSDNSNTSEPAKVSTVKDTTENSNSDQPQTGDHNDVTPWAVMLITGAAMSAVILKKRTDK